MASVSFWKVFSLLGTIGSWAAKALAPDANGKVTITIDELEDLARMLCDTFGWKADIDLHAEDWEKFRP
jgi:hypothetical protein